MSYFMEILGAVLGVTRQGVLPSILQTCSRIFVTFFACGNDQIWITSLLFLSWGISDTARFLYYLVPPLKKPRYYVSYAMYPFGVFCELYLMILRRTRACFVGVMVYAPGFYYLYKRVLRKLRSMPTFKAHTE